MLRGFPVQAGGVPEQLREYRYRRLVGGLTHEQFENEPAVTVDWLIAIDNVVAKVRQDKTEEARRG